MKELILLYVNGQIKGIVTKLPACPKWWHESKEIEVPQEDWDNDKVRIDTIHKYI
jgi:hypothetical protein